MLKITLYNFKVYESLETELTKVGSIVKENGAGKTSFLQGLRWGLLGEFSSSFLRYGTNECSVTITTDSFNIKRVYDGKKQSVFVNGAASTIKDCNSLLSKEFGGLEVLSALLDTKDFESFSKDNNSFRNFLLSFLPVRVKRESLFKFIEEVKALSDEERAFFEKELNKDFFVIDDIDVYYKDFYDRRRDANKVVKDLKGKITTTSIDLPSESEEELKEVLADIIFAEKSASEYERRMQEHLRSKKEAERISARKAQLEAFLAEESKYPMMDANAETELRKRKDFLFTVYQLKQKELASAEASLNASKSAYMGFQSKKCPYMTDFSCPADHEKIMGTILASATAQRTVADEAKKEIESALSEMKEIDSKIFELSKIANIRGKFEAAREELGNLIIPEILPEPEKLDSSSIICRKAEVEEKLSRISAYKMAESFKEPYEKAMKEAEILDSACTLFSEKGVKATILSKVLKPVEEIVNNKGEVAGMKITFINGGEFNPLVLYKGQKVSLSLLSSGEFIVLSYILMSAINSIVKCKILALDNLDKLDGENTLKLIKLIETEGSFQYTILSGVNHRELDDCMSKYKLF